MMLSHDYDQETLIPYARHGISSALEITLASMYPSRQTGTLLAQVKFMVCHCHHQDQAYHPVCGLVSDYIQSPHQLPASNCCAWWRSG